MRNGYRTRHVVLLALASVAAGLAGDASAGVLVYDSFNSYSPGNLVDSAAPVAASGTGLTGNYASTTVGATDSISVVSGGLSFSTLNSSAGNAVQLSAGDSAAIATVTLDASVGTLSDVTLWGSYLVQPSSPGAATSAVAEVRISTAASASAAQSRLRSVTDSSTAASGSAFMPAIGVSGATLGSSGSLLVNGSTYLIISKFTRVGATLDVANPGVASLWAMDATQYNAFIAGGGGETYLATATVAGGQLSAFATSTATSGAAAFTAGNFIQLVDGWGAAGGNTTQTYLLDELRYGTSLGDVGGTVPEPASAALVAVAAGLLARRSRQTPEYRG